MANKKLPRGGLPILQESKETFEILRTNHNRRRNRKMRNRFAQQGHVLNHLTERVNFAPDAALDWLPRKLQSPLENMTRTPEG